MEHIYIDIRYQAYFNSNRNNATAKPRLDSQRTAEKYGYKTKLFYASDVKPVSFTKKCLYVLSTGLLFLRLLSLITLSGKRLLFQFPCPSNVLYPIVCLLSKRNEVIILLHDLTSVRINKEYPLETNALKRSKLVIVHSTQMEKIMRDRGINTHYVNLEFFDYLTSDEEKVPALEGTVNVMYAGNLTKSVFLKRLDKVKDIDKFNMFLYGSGWSDSITNCPTVKYKGSFDSDKISGVEGNWGLVWDGEDIGTCSGNYGNYLRINAPFKFSLSLALGIPVIVWTQSAMAHNVAKYHLGICVDSLDDIYNTIRKLSCEEVKEIHDNVASYSKRVRNGYMLTKALNEADQKLNALS